MDHIPVVPTINTRCASSSFRYKISSSIHSEKASSSTKISKDSTPGFPVLTLVSEKKTKDVRTYKCISVILHRAQYNSTLIPTTSSHPTRLPLSSSLCPCPLSKIQVIGQPWPTHKTSKGPKAPSHTLQTNRPRPSNTPTAHTSKRSTHHPNTLTPPKPHAKTGGKTTSPNVKSQMTPQPILIPGMPPFISTVLDSPPHVTQDSPLRRKDPGAEAPLQALMEGMRESRHKPLRGRGVLFVGEERSPLVGVFRA